MKSLIQHLPCFFPLETEFLGCLFNHTAQIHDLLEVQGRSSKQKCHTGVTQFVTLAEYGLWGRFYLKLFKRKNFPPLSVHLTFNTCFCFPVSRKATLGAAASASASGYQSLPSSSQIWVCPTVVGDAALLLSPWESFILIFSSLSQLQM